MPTYIKNLGVGTGIPQWVQFGQKFIGCCEDTRPFYLLAAYNDSSLKAFDSGIKAPTAAPVAAAASADHVNMVTGTVLSIVYAFNSTSRNVRSQISPAVSFTVTGKKVLINSFQPPRDDAAGQNIDSIIVGVQAGLTNGAMCVFPDMLVMVSDLNFAGASLTFDISNSTLALGTDLSAGDAYFAIPPATKYLNQFQERVWYGGVRRQVNFSDTDIVVTHGQTFRPTAALPTRAKVVISGSQRWNDSYYWMSLFANGQYLGEVFDVDSSTVLYLDRDLPASVTSTSDFYLVGHGDRLYPSSWHTYTPGGVAIAYPECVNIDDAVPLPVVLDRGETLMAIKQNQGQLAPIFNETVLMGSGQDQPGSPTIGFSRLYGRVGAIAPRSAVTAPDGGAAWVGEEGLIVGDTAGVNSIAFQLRVNSFFGKNPRWMATTDLPNLVMSWSRQWDGYVIGNFTINGDPNFWALISFQPQRGLWLFDGQQMTANILEVQDSNGQGRLYTGDSFEGRVKELLVRNATPTDVQVASDTSAAYDWSYRHGWIFVKNRDVVDVVRPYGIVLPDNTSFDFNIVRWELNQLVRNEADFPTDTITTDPFTEADLNGDLALTAGGGRIWTSLAFESTSTSGANNGRLAELTKLDDLLILPETP